MRILGAWVDRLIVDIYCNSILPLLPSTRNICKDSASIHNHKVGFLKIRCFNIFLYIVLNDIEDILKISLQQARLSFYSAKRLQFSDMQEHLIPLQQFDMEYASKSIPAKY